MHWVFICIAGKMESTANPISHFFASDMSSVIYLVPSLLNGHVFERPTATCRTYLLSHVQGTENTITRFQEKRILMSQQHQQITVTCIFAPDKKAYSADCVCPSVGELDIRKKETDLDKM
jgi:hypothetical protein